MLVDRSTYLLRPHTTADLLLSIDNHLIRIRRDYLININYLRFIENQSLRCILRSPFNDIILLASRRYYPHILKKLNLI